MIGYPSAMPFWATIAGSLLLLAAVLGVWAAMGDPARGRLRCPGGWRRVLALFPWRSGCWYDMSGVADDTGSATPLPALQCPECGRRWLSRAALQRARVRWRLLALALLISLLAYAASLMPRVQKHGPWAAAPTWSLVLLAPVDDYCRGALGCPFSWQAMPDSTRELMTPTWDRPFARWETAILKRRLDAGVARVRPEFPGRDVAFIPAAKYERASWWNWGRPLTDSQRERFTWTPASAASGVVLTEADPRDRWSPTAGLLVRGTDAQHLALWRTMLDALDSVRPGQPLVNHTTNPRDGTPLVLAVFDVSQISPRALVPARTPGLYGMTMDSAYAPDDPVPDPVLDRLRLAISTVSQVAHPPQVQAIPLGSGQRISGIRGMLLIRQSPDRFELTRRVVEAILHASANATSVSDPIPTPTAGLTIRVVNAIDLAEDADAITHPTSDLDLGIERAAAMTGRAMWMIRNSQTASAIAVGPILVLIGSADEHSAALAELERLRAELPETPKAEDPPP